MVCRVLHAAKLVMVHDVACHADGEQLADPRRKDAFRNHAGVRAGDDDGVGALPMLTGLLSDGGGYVARIAYGVQVALVALL